MVFRATLPLPPDPQILVEDFLASIISLTLSIHFGFALSGPQEFLFPSLHACNAVVLFL